MLIASGALTTAFSFGAKLGGSKQQADERAKEAAGCLSVESRNLVLRNIWFIFTPKRHDCLLCQTCEPSLTEPCQLVRPRQLEES